ncbi:HNH endonuclease [Bacillus sp. NPDC077411]|uniref:HNH endonuclease n=1 Tax=Bacillus sp. NPDC077411 TaxID=3363947 RepID=UPI0037C58FC5
MKSNYDELVVADESPVSVLNEVVELLSEETPWRENQAQYFEHITEEEKAGEFWVKHPKYNILCSNLGRIYRLEYKGTDGRELKGKVAKLTELENKYLVVTIEGTQRRVSRLIAETFKPHHYSDNLDCDHFDNNRWNNRHSNLSWMSSEDNRVKAVRDNAKLNYIGFYTVLKYIEMNLTDKQIAERFEPLECGAKLTDKDVNGIRRKYAYKSYHEMYSNGVSPFYGKKAL